jgi:hypothetical protein
MAKRKIVWVNHGACQMFLVAMWLSEVGGFQIFLLSYYQTLQSNFVIKYTINWMIFVIKYTIIYWWYFVLTAMRIFFSFEWQYYKEINTVKISFQSSVFSIIPRCTVRLFLFVTSEIFKDMRRMYLLSPFYKIWLIIEVVKWIYFWWFFICTSPGSQPRTTFAIQ